jgi:hypothetical protein
LSRRKSLLERRKVKVTPRTEEEARRASSRELIKPGWVNSTIDEASETKSRMGRPMLALRHLVPMPDGSERELRDWLLDADAVAEKLRSAVVAVDALEQFERGELAAEDFAGRSVQIRVGIEKRRGMPDRNYVESYRAVPSSPVVALRAAGG